MIDLLLNESFVRSAFPWFAAVTPVLALLLYAAGLGRSRGGRYESVSGGGDPEGRPKPVSPEETAGKERTSTRGGRVFLVALGLFGPVVWILWILYESIMDVFGFASVKGLLIVLGVFVVLGLAAGYVLRRAVSPRA